MDGVERTLSDNPLALVKAFIESLEKSEAANVADTAALSVLAKSVPDQRYTLGLAYPANRAPGTGADGHNDVWSAEDLEHTAWEWMRKSRSLGLWHEDGTEGHGDVVESYIYRGPDWIVKAADGTDYTIKAGDWLIGTVWDSSTFALVKARLMNGLSPQGKAKRRALTPERITELGMNA